MRAALLTGALLLALAAPALAAAPAPARVQVVADEFSFTLSRPSIKAGAAIVQLANFGEDPHDLRLRRVGGTRTYAIRVTRPGGVTDLSARFLPGKFVLWCSLVDHRTRGMQAVLTIRP